MEHQTLTSMLGFFGYDDIVVHELAHQWWGDDVTCATWHDIWLNEGFATYAQALWYEFRPGSSGEPALHQAMSYLRPYSYSGTVYRYDISYPDVIFDDDLSYRKGGWVLHMLRHVLGDSAFFETLARYRATYQGSAATTADFEHVAEAVAGRDLSWFFGRWVYAGGVPSYSYGWRSYVIDGQGYVEVYVDRLGASPTMPIDIATTDSTGTHTHVIWNDARKENLLFAVEGTNVTAVAFDPKPWILWSSRTAINFVEGPPKIVTMKPVPSSTLKSTDLPALEIVFQKSVVASDADFLLNGARHGPVSLTFAYDDVRHAVTLTPAEPLLSDTYTFTVSDSIVDVASGQKLDGELVKPFDPLTLPSGEGLPGESTVAQFIVTVAGDTNCDGAVNADDIGPFLAALGSRAGYEAVNPGCPFVNADCNGDGLVTFADINPFVRLLTDQ